MSDAPNGKLNRRKPRPLVIAKGIGISRHPGADYKGLNNNEVNLLQLE